MSKTATGALPDFLMLGAQECGTESLYWTVARHPNVVPAARKEVHFYDRHYARGLSWYREQFEPPAPGIVTGEASPYYLFHPHVPERVAATLPEARFVVILRNPVDRALHHYEHNRKKGHIDATTFEAALDGEVERFAAAHRQLLEDPLRNDPVHRHESYLVRGRYVEQLLRWEEHFPADRFLVVQSEALFRDPAPVVAEVLEFLDLP